MSAVRLSICIATLNRAEFIGATLESIVSQATNDVEIVVVDGASTDGTAKIVQCFQQRCPALRYLRQERNQGIDKDFALAVDLARGEYCWLFSDDDLMKPGAIQRVLQELQGKYGLVIVNAEIRDGSIVKVLQARRIAIEEDRIYRPDEGDRLLADLADYMTFIGCVLIRKSIWDARDKEQYFGSLFIHVGVIFQSRFPENSLLIAEPLIAIRYGNALWLEKSFEIWMFKWPGLVWSFDKFSDEAKRRVCKKEPWRSPAVLLLNRARGGYTLAMYQKWLKPQRQTFWNRAVAQAIARLPGVLTNTVVFLLYWANVRNPYRRVGLVDLRNSRFYFRNFGETAHTNRPPSRQVPSQVSSH
jgi:abequosyltransferase